MKSERQKKIAKHANRPRIEKLFKWTAVSLSVVFISIPVVLKYLYGG